MSQLAEPPPADDEIRFVALQRCSCRLAPLTRVTVCRASPALKAEAGVDDDEPPLPRRPPSGDGEHNTVDHKTVSFSSISVRDWPSEGAGGKIHTRLDSRGLPMFARPGQVSPTPSDTTLAESLSDVPVSPASREASETARGETGFTVPPREKGIVASSPEDSLSLADCRTEQQQVKAPRKLSFQSIQEEGEPQDEDAQLREQQEMRGEVAGGLGSPRSDGVGVGGRERRGSFAESFKGLFRTASFTRTSSFDSQLREQPAMPGEVAGGLGSPRSDGVGVGGRERRGSFAESFKGLFPIPSFTRTSSFDSTGTFLPAFTRTSSFTRTGSFGSKIAAGEDGSASPVDNAAGQHSGTRARSSFSRWLPTGNASSGKLVPDDSVHSVGGHRLKQVFEQASGILTSKTESAQNTEWENLFVSIAGHRDSTISVSGDLGETLIRLGISIEFRTLQQTIHKVAYTPQLLCIYCLAARSTLLCYFRMKKALSVIRITS